MWFGMTIAHMQHASTASIADPDELSGVLCDRFKCHAHLD